MFKKIYFDHIYKDQLHVLAAKEKWITRYNDNHSCRFNELDLRKRNYLKQKILLLITLFEKLDSDYSPYDLSILMDEGIIDKKSGIVTGLVNPNLGSNIDELASEVTINLMRNNSHQVIRSHIRSSPKGYYQKVSKYKNRPDPSAPPESSLPDGYTSLFWGQFDHDDLQKEYERIMDYVHDADKIEENEKFRMTEAFYDHIKYINMNLKYCALSSISENSSFVSGITQSKDIKIQREVDLIDELYYIVKTRINDERIILPHPRNLREALKFRNAPEMQQFREVISEWCSTIEQGHYQAEKKIRKDIGKASRALKRAGCWREYENSPVNFWLNCIGGHIPILSNVLTVINTAGVAYKHFAERSSKWRLLIQ